MLFIDFAYELTSKFPKEEMLGLTSQFRRAENSIALNIGEGFGESIALGLRYLRISRGSIRECVVCVTIAQNRAYLTNTEVNKARELLSELSKCQWDIKSILKVK